jgi:hypothetical protein
MTEDAGNPVMRLLAFLLTLLIPAAAASGDGVLPKYPPGFDCSAVAAGSARQACNKSHLDPPMGPIEGPKPAQPKTVVPPVTPQLLPTTPPPTVPRLPGTVPNRN